MRLPVPATSGGYRLLCLGSTGSTNEDGLRLSAQGDPGRLWIVADEQTRGRGRHGRPWASPPGNLHASLLLIDPCSMAEAPEIGFVAGLALHDAACAATGLAVPELGLKWPNDLLLAGAKCAGLLVEAQGRNGGFAAVIGFGVDVASAPSGTPYPTACLAGRAPGVTREAVFEELAAAFVIRYETWRRLGFAATRLAWLERAAGLGSEVGVRLAEGERRGTFRDIDERGRLRLDTPAGPLTVDAGDLLLHHDNWAGDGSRTSRGH